jgi:hypothetical protein
MRHYKHYCRIVDGLVDAQIKIKDGCEEIRSILTDEDEKIMDLALSSPPFSYTNREFEQKLKTLPINELQTLTEKHIEAHRILMKLFVKYRMAKGLYIH